MTSAGFDPVLALQSLDHHGVRFVVIGKQGGEWSGAALDPSLLLNELQLVGMSTRPALIRQFARHVAERERAAGRDVEVHADIRVSLNGRPLEPLVDPRADLAAARPREPWILPATLPLHAAAGQGGLPDLAASELLRE